MAFLLWIPVLPAMQEETSRENVQRLIFQLDEASSFSARNAIVEKLKELGGNALPILEMPPKGIRQQTGQILLKIRNDIEKRLSTEEVAAWIRLIFAGSLAVMGIVLPAVKLGTVN